MTTLDSKTIEAVIAKLEKRLERQNKQAQRWFNEGNDTMWQWYQSRATELEFAINDIREMAA